jgi:hypothetical protein
VKSIKKSIATEVEFSVVPVDKSTMLCVGVGCELPRCTPPDVPTTKVADEVLMREPSGIVPMAFTGTEPNRFAPTPAANPFVQFAMSAKFSV